MNLTNHKFCILISITLLFFSCKSSQNIPTQEKTRDYKIKKMNEALNICWEARSKFRNPESDFSLQLRESDLSLWNPASIYDLMIENESGKVEELDVNLYKKHRVDSGDIWLGFSKNKIIYKDESGKVRELKARDFSDFDVDLYKKHRVESGDIWLEFSKKNRTAYYGHGDLAYKDSDNISNMIVLPIVGLATFGFGLLMLLDEDFRYISPPYDYYVYDGRSYDYESNKYIVTGIENRRPNYSGVIDYCDKMLIEAEDNKKLLIRYKEFQIKKGKRALELMKQQEILKKSQEEEYLKQEKEMEKKEFLARKKQAEKAREAKNRFQDKIELENRYSQSLGYIGIWGYDKKYYNGGILDVILSLQQGSFVENEKNFLIKRGRGGFVVENIVGNHAIYSFVSDSFRVYRFALKMNKGKSYLQDSVLKGKYFAIVGTQMFKTVMGQEVEILVFENIE